jgi:hypothetical protein
MAADHRIPRKPAAISVIVLEYVLAATFLLQLAGKAFLAVGAIRVKERHPGLLAKPTTARAEHRATRSVSGAELLDHPVPHRSALVMILLAAEEHGVAAVRERFSG